jgi:hypothetical protein
MLYYHCLEYAIRKFQENQVGLKLNGTHQILAYADDVNLLGDNIDAIKEYTGTLIDARSKSGQKIANEVMQSGNNTIIKDRVAFADIYMY